MTEQHLLDYMYVLVFLLVGLGDSLPCQLLPLCPDVSRFRCVLYLFLVTAAYNKVSGLRGVTELFLFVGILSLAVIYALATGVFSWKKNDQAS